jgi:large-conductance mechanosensitive channel
MASVIGRRPGQMDTAFAAGKYLSWGVLSISLTNFLVIAVMVVLFVLALVVPFPRDRVSTSHDAAPAPPPSSTEDRP